MYLDGDITKEEWHDKKQSFDNQLNIYEKQLKMINLSDKQSIDEGKNIIKTAKIKENTPGAIRTRDPLLRRQMLYPAELRTHLYCKDNT